MNYLIKEKSINNAQKQFINFSSTLQNSIDYFSEIAKLKAINLKYDVQEDIYINFVPTKLQKLIDNNLSNAIKYSYENQDVVISLKQKDDEIILSFKDQGIGISDTTKIFSRYYREDHTKGGFGIGLNIVSQILKDENIKVELTSELKKGTTFKYVF
jgi:signal transduction histidine kinase